MSFSRAFTLIEVLIVIVILGILTTLAMTNYGYATQKARVQIGAEQLISLLDEVRVNASSGVGVGTESTSEALCWGVQVAVDKKPVTRSFPLRESGCAVAESSDDDETLEWGEGLLIGEVSVVPLVSGEPAPSRSLNSATMLFVPPSGEMRVYDPVGRTYLSNPSEVFFSVRFDREGVEPLEKRVRVVPATGIFDIL